jgi:hypothetical protein
MRVKQDASITASSNIIGKILKELNILPIGLEAKLALHMQIDLQFCK